MAAIKAFCVLVSFVGRRNEGMGNEGVAMLDLFCELKAGGAALRGML
jgi:hypothetical protein